jgi:glucose-1-phosphate cytidylyltransferase
MIEIGNMPILNHIMKIYSHWGWKDFIVCIGYKGQMIKDYFLNHLYYNNDFTITTANLEVLDWFENYDDWTVTLVNTGEYTDTAARIKKIQKYLSPNDTFLLTYGDGLTDVNINNIIDFHKRKGKIATLLAVKAQSRFGVLETDASSNVKSFGEKIKDKNFVNGGFYVLNTEIFKYIHDDNESFERDILPRLVKDKQLSAYKYDGFWKCMDSLKDKEELTQLWNSNKAPWKLW